MDLYRKAYIGVMSPATLAVYLFSVYASRESFFWTDLSPVVSPFHNFAMFFGLYVLFYKGSRIENQFVSVCWLLVVGFTVIDCIHSLGTIFMKFYAGVSIYEARNLVFDQYNPISCLFAIVIGLALCVLYIANWRHIWRWAKR